MQQRAALDVGDLRLELRLQLLLVREGEAEAERRLPDLGPRDARGVPGGGAPRGSRARDEFMALPMVSLCWLMGFAYNAYIPRPYEKNRKEVVDALVAAEMCACDPNDHGVEPLDIARSNGHKKLVKLLKGLRLVRLLKLLRLVKASRMFQRLESKIAVPYAYLSLSKFLVLLLISGHWFACLWVMIAELENTGSNWTNSLYEFSDAVVSSTEMAFVYNLGHGHGAGVGVGGAMNLQGHKVQLAYGGCIAQVWKPEGDAKGQQCQ